MVSAVLFLALRSPYVVVFALLGPVIALASWWEARRQHRLSLLTQEAAAREEEAREELTRRRNDEAHRAQQLERYPHPTRWLDNPLWQPPQGDRGPTIRLGLAALPAASGAIAPGMPYLLEAPQGIAVVGPPQHTEGAWQALVAQVLVHCPRGTLTGFDALWPDDSAPQARIVVPWGVEGRMIVQRCDRDDEVDPGVEMVIRLTRAGSGDLYRRGVLEYRSIALDKLTTHDARWVRDYLTRRHPDASRVRSEPPPVSRSQLVVQWAPGKWRDLVSCGPHAVVWGQSGSGKTVLLRTLVHSLARRYTPEQVQVVWIDFKGGSGALGLTSLPHVVGVLTDLQPHRVSRVYQGLAAEIRKRETLLANHGVSDLSELSEGVLCPRTLVVIDEVGIVLRDYPQWNELLTDLSSRGRALGLHLVIAGQRLQGQVPRSVLANASLRMCLRVGDVTEALDFLCTAHPAQIDTLLGAPPGSVLVSDASEVSSSTVVSEIEGDVRAGTGVPLWCEPLPPRIDSGPANALAIMDDPARQSQPPLLLADIPSGMVVVTGDSGSGHSTLLSRWVRASADADSVFTSTESVAFTDEILTLLRDPQRIPRVILVDRVDRICRSQSESYREWMMGCLVRLARIAADQPSPQHLVITAAPDSPEAQALARESVTQLFLASRHRPLHDSANVLIPPDAPVGCVQWNSMVGQVIAAPPRDRASVIEHCSESATRDDLVVSGIDDIPGSISVAESDERFFDIERAYRRSRLVLVGASGETLRALRIPPVPATEPTHGWRLGPSGAELIRIEPLRLGENRIDADRVNS